jgi:hypothetical protein
MTTRVRVANVDARSNSQGLSLPVTRGIVACHFLDGPAEAVRNRIDGQADGTIAGSPSWSDGYGSFTGSTTYVSTAIEDADLTNVSILTVCRSSAAFSASASRPHLAGSYGAVGSDVYAAAIMVSGTPSSAPAATVQLLVSRDNGSGAPTGASASITVADLSDWTILAATIAGAGGTGAMKIYDLTNNVSASGDLATARLPHPTRLYQIGASSSSLIGGAVDSAGALIANVVLTEAELTRLAAGIRRRMLAAHGIVC